MRQDFRFTVTCEDSREYLFHVRELERGASVIWWLTHEMYTGCPVRLEAFSLGEFETLGLAESRALLLARVFHNSKPVRVKLC